MCHCLSAQVGQESPAAGPERGPRAGGRGLGWHGVFSLLLSCLVPGQLPLEGLGDRRKGLADAVWLGGGSFLCRRKLLPFQAVGVAGLCCGASCCWLSRDIMCWGEERVGGSWVLVLDATCCQISAPFPARPSWSRSSLQHQTFWLRTLPCPGLLCDCVLGGS